MKLHAVFKSIAFVGSVALSIARVSATDPAINIGSVVSITGPAAPLGDPEAKTLVNALRISAVTSLLGFEIILQCGRLTWLPPR